MKKLIQFCLLALVAAAPLAAQQLPDLNRPRTIDVQHYEIHVRFDTAAKKVFGDTTVSFKPLAAGFSTLELDAVGLKFDSVTMADSGEKLKFTAGAKSVRVALGREFGPDATVAVRFRYSTTPEKGVYFRDALPPPAKLAHSAQIFSQGEAEEARYWFPSFDFPSDKATTEEFITAKTGLAVIGNGVLIDKSDTPDGSTTWHYKMPVPHSTYLVSFVVGDYVRLEDKAGSIPLAYYTYPGTEDTARAAFRSTPKMIETFERLTGVKFPYNKYDQTVVSTFQFGGMENITATTMADAEILESQLGLAGNTTDLVSHELAHSWFGDLVTCKNWGELWLNEGFATYMEAAYAEETAGPQAYMDHLNLDTFQFKIDDLVSRRRHGLFNRLAGDVDRLFDVSAVTYNKGGVVLHMLREQVGKENFWKALNAYLNEHKFDNVETSDLRRAMEQQSGQDLKWFFDQWVYGIGYPTVTVRHTYRPASKTVVLTFTQTQSPIKAKPATYRIPVDIEFETAGETTRESVIMTRRMQTFTIKVPSAPKKIVLDPDSKVMLATFSQK